MLYAFVSAQDSENEGHLEVYDRLMLHPDDGSSHPRQHACALLLATELATHTFASQRYTAGRLTRVNRVAGMTLDVR